MEKEIQKLVLLDEEYWWGGISQNGINMPYGKNKISVDLGWDLANNQGNPLLISSKGRYVWSEKPFKYTFESGNLLIEGIKDSIDMGEGFSNLREVFKHVSGKYFPSVGKAPEKMLFTAPQYNTWIEMMYDTTQEKVINFAKTIIEKDMPAGVLILDDNWNKDYGIWSFEGLRFPDPKKMMEELHSLGFKVVLWVCPFVSADSIEFRELDQKGYLIKDKNGVAAIRKWWNGYSAVLDCTNPETVEWFCDKLKYLMDSYGVDGFKFDAGDLEFYSNDDINFKQADKNDQCKAWAEIGLRYEMSEYRACWKMAGQPLVQRLSDKCHSWDETGLAALIPNGLAQGLLGYQFICPDMIGGGNFTDFLEGSFHLDQELIVRYAQCSALFPAMQFSIAPWRILDSENFEYCRKAAILHSELAGEIEVLIEHAAHTGEPVLRHLAYEFPSMGYENITDQYMLGSSILAAPVIKKGETERDVTFPPGRWLGDDGTVVEGPCKKRVTAPLYRLPWYRKDVTAPSDYSTSGYMKD